MNGSDYLDQLELLNKATDKRLEYVIRGTCSSAQEQLVALARLVDHQLFYIITSNL